MHCTLVDMEIVVTEEKENPFLKRKELKLRLKHLDSSTPSKADVVKDLASKYSVADNQIVIDYIYSLKGLSESIVKVKILEGAK